MKKTFIFFCFVLACFSSNAAIKYSWTESLSSKPEFKSLTQEFSNMSQTDFLTMTPKKYRDMTGEKLGLKKTLVLKAAQKQIQKDLAAGTDIPKGLYIVLAILGGGWLAIGLITGFSGNDWWINLILTALCWLPGVIHALIVMKKYY